MGLRVLLLGDGGREHALAWSINKSDLLDELYIAPGNPGTDSVGTNVPLSLSDFSEIQEFIEDKKIDLTVVGPEDPLVGGIADFLEEKDHKVFGPSKQAAQLEGSKSFANHFMIKRGIPTAGYAVFKRHEFDKVIDYVRKEESFPVVLKADGLAGGKGVFICEEESEVLETLETLKESPKLSDAADTLVVEEFLEGEEASVFAICDGETAKIIHNAQDHKRIGEGDTGPNTGGMGAYCPAPVMTDRLLEQVEREIVLPTLTGMILDDTPYKGILYLGLMITEEGPKVVEYNCRFGDPECQPIVQALNSDLLKHMWAAVNQNLSQEEIELDNQYHSCVVMSSHGYPGEYEKGKKIEGLEDVSDEALVFHAGTALNDDGDLITDGGRVLSVVCSGEDLEQSLKTTYEQIERIKFENAYYRSDIGYKGLEHLNRDLESS